MRENVTLIGTIVLASLFMCCEKDNPCSRLVNGVFQYPELTGNPGFSKQETYKYFDIPNDVKRCISTKGLIESCLFYPQASLMYASSSGLQAGYGWLRSVFSGLSELEARTDAGAQLLSAYESIDPLKVSSFEKEIDQGRYALRLNYLEIIIGQYSNLSKLSVQQKRALVSRARAVYSKKEKEDVYGESGLGVTSVLLGRLMNQDDYVPFMEVKDQINWNIAENFWSVDAQATGTIYSLSEDYLRFLDLGR
jgi:hypothetical protein